ncbi:MAG: hypothetical protein AB1679_32120 [Actinomycetota bacterium]
MWVAGLVVPLVAVGGLMVFVTARSSDDRRAGDGSSLPAGGQAATQWLAGVDRLFRPIAGGLVRLLREGAEWRAGTRSDADFAGLVHQLLPGFVADAEKVAAMPALESAPRAKPLLVASAQLYVECLRVTEVAVGKHGDLRRQLDLAGQRLRILGDRVYDRARVAVDPKALDPPPAGAVELHLPEDVPDWPATGLAAGPPLAATAPAEGGLPGERQPSRPEQPEAAWLQAVQAAGIPAAADIAGAIEAGRRETLDGLAARLEQAADALADVPDPHGGRERAATVRLGLLVHAEAARAGLAAALLSDHADHRAALLALARRLLVIGDGLWDPALPSRSSAADPASSSPSHQPSGNQR